MRGGLGRRNEKGQREQRIVLWGREKGSFWEGFEASAETLVEMVGVVVVVVVMESFTSR